MAERIVSLLPAATEILFAMGLGDRVVAVSHACHHPPEAAALPKALRTRVDPGGSSRAIDEQVRTLTEAGEPLYVVDEGVIHHVQPDAIVAQATCDVCAAGPEHVHAALMRIEPVDRPEILTLHAHDLDGVLASITELADAVGAPEAGRSLVDELEARLAVVDEAVATVATEPEALVLDWLDPPMVAGHWVPELVGRAGGQPVLVEPGEPSRYVGWPEIQATQADHIVLAPCGLSQAEARQDAEALAEHEAWQALEAVSAGRVHLAADEAPLETPGPRLIDALEALTVTLHPRLAEVLEAEPLPGLR